jgi:hypothetical protein
VYQLYAQGLESWVAGPRPDVVLCKCLYLFAKAEGYAVKEQWLPSLPAADRAEAEAMLHRPVAGQTISAAAVEMLLQSLKTWLANHTDILI